MREAIEEVSSFSDDDAEVSYVHELLEKPKRVAKAQHDVQQTQAEPIGEASALVEDGK